MDRVTFLINPVDHKMTKTIFGMCVLCVVLFAIGCGNNKLKTEEVIGTIKFDGKPLPNATVNFTPAEGSTGVPGFGKTDESGVYKLQALQGEADAGTVPGKYLVSVIATEMVPTGKKITTYDEVGNVIKMDETKSKTLIPVRYSDVQKSELTATVEAGGGVFDFNLTK